MPTSLQGIAKRAREQKKHRFQDLYRMLNEGYLLDCWRYIRKDAAYGVDKMSAGEYERDLEENIRDLVERLKRGSYRAKLVRRKYIPKEEGKMRPLGIPAIEDKLLQIAVKRILEAIYEQDFLRCSYGYRPGVGALDAVDKLTVKLQFGRYNFVVEADIKSFFDNVDHEWVIRMLEERIDDQLFLRLIKKWLKAGILEPDGEVIHPVTGTPQGGIVSPILANVYLHYVLDLWFHKVVKKYCKGEACLIRYADDYVCAFQYQEDAESFYRAMGKRLGKFRLKLSEKKTRVKRFSRDHQPGKASFDFLGFEFRWGEDRGGRPHLKRRTSRKKLRRSLRNLADWCRANRHLRVDVLFRKLNAKLRGYYNYYGVVGNYASLAKFFEQVLRILFKWLNRCSQRSRYNWRGFQELIELFNIERPRIVGRPKTRRATSTA
jgi:RNA-directed DNA polymerase